MSDHMTDEEVERLAQIASELVVRVRDESPEDNYWWLMQTLPDPADWWRLCIVLAAVVPDDQSWRSLTAWRWQTQPRAKHGSVRAAVEHIRRWATVDKLSDAQIAIKLGCNKTAVGKVRRSANPPIPSARRSKRYGCTQSSNGQATTMRKVA